MSPRSIATKVSILLAFTIPWEDSVEVPGIGTVSRAVGLLLAGAWFLAMLSPGRHRRLLPVHGALFMFVVWTGASIVWSRDPVKSISGFETNVQLLLLVLILWEMLDTQQLIDRALQAYVFGCIVSIIGVMNSYFSGNPTKYLRYGAPGADLDNNALILALAIPAAIYLGAGPTARAGSKALRVFNLAFVPAAAYAMVLTATRGAVIASIPTLVFGLWAFARSGRGWRFAAVALVGISVYVVASYAPASSLERIGSITTELEAGGDLNGRTSIWRESIDAFLERPLIGVGNDAHRAAIEIGKVAHNTLVSIIAETGLIGVALFLNILVRAQRELRGLQGFVSRYWVTQLAVVVIGSMTLSIEDRKSTWLFVALAIGAASLTQEIRRRPPNASGASPLPPPSGPMVAPGRAAFIPIGRP